MTFPTGILVDVLSVALGAIVGGLIRRWMPERIGKSLFIVTSFCAISIGIISVIKLESLTVVMVSVLLGCVLGELCYLEAGIGKVIAFAASRLEGHREIPEEEKKERMDLLSLSMAIICFSGTGFFGALSEGLDGDHSVLLAKAVLDFFTVLVIATQIGYFIGLFAIPQAIIFIACYFLAQLISPILTTASINNFKSVGGVLTIVVGYNMLASQVGIKKVKVLNLTPAFILVFLLSWLVTYLPFTI